MSPERPPLFSTHSVLPTSCTPCVSCMPHFAYSTRTFLRFAFLFLGCLSTACWCPALRRHPPHPRHSRHHHSCLSFEGTLPIFLNTNTLLPHSPPHATGSKKRAEDRHLTAPHKGAVSSNHGRGEQGCACGLSIGWLPGERYFCMSLCQCLLSCPYHGCGGGIKCAI